MNADDVLKRYKDENLPDFAGIELSDVNQTGVFGDMPRSRRCWMAAPMRMRRASSATPRCTRP
jgi:hypothetical protein